MLNSLNIFYSNTNHGSCLIKVKTKDHCLALLDKSVLSELLGNLIRLATAKCFTFTCIV